MLWQVMQKDAGTMLPQPELSWSHHGCRVPTSLSARDGASVPEVVQGTRELWQGKSH